MCVEICKKIFAHTDVVNYRAYLHAFLGTDEYWWVPIWALAYWNQHVHYHNSSNPDLLTSCSKVQSIQLRLRGKGDAEITTYFPLFFQTPTSVIRTPTTPNTPHPTAKEMGKENLHPILPPHPPYPHLQRTRMTWQTGIVYPCELFIWRPISPNFPNANRRKTNGLDDKYPRESPRPEHS